MAKKSLKGKSLAAMRRRAAHARASRKSVAKHSTSTISLDLDRMRIKRGAKAWRKMSAAEKRRFL